MDNYITPRHNHQPQQLSFTEVEKQNILNKGWLSTQELAAYYAEVSLGLLKLKTLYPAIVGKYSNQEYDIMLALWLQTIIEAIFDDETDCYSFFDDHTPSYEPGIIGKAISQFIKTDTSGFFPCPGIIIKIIKDLQKQSQYRLWEEIEYAKINR